MSLILECTALSCPQVLANFGFLSALFSGRIVQRIFFGPLQPREIEVSLLLLLPCRVSTDGRLPSVSTTRHGCSSQNPYWRLPYFGTTLTSHLLLCLASFFLSSAFTGLWPTAWNRYVWFCKYFERGHHLRHKHTHTLVNCLNVPPSLYLVSGSIVNMSHTFQMDQVPYPGPPLLFHVRINSLFLILWLVDFVMLAMAIDSTLTNGVGGMVLFANEVSADISQIQCL